MVLLNIFDAFCFKHSVSILEIIIENLCNVLLKTLKIRYNISNKNKNEKKIPIKIATYMVFLNICDAFFFLISVNKLEIIIQNFCNVLLKTLNKNKLCAENNFFL